jgi:hypothetical protein
VLSGATPKQCSGRSTVCLHRLRLTMITPLYILSSSRYRIFTSDL